MNERFYIFEAGQGMRPFGNLTGFELESDAMASLLAAGAGGNKCLICRGPYTREKFIQIIKANGWNVVERDGSLWIERYTGKEVICGISPFKCDDSKEEDWRERERCSECGEYNVHCSCGDVCEDCNCSPCECDQGQPGDFHCSAAKYPPVTEALGRKFESFPEWLGKGFPESQNKRINLIRERLESLPRDAEQYEDIRTRGEAALSRYDVEICSGGDADSAVRMALSFKWNHIAYGLLHVQYAEQQWPRLVEALRLELANGGGKAAGNETVCDECGESECVCGDDSEECVTCGCVPCSCDEGIEPEEDGEEFELTPSASTKTAQLSLF